MSEPVNHELARQNDLWNIRQAFEIDRSHLAGAISATFARRGTAIPDAILDRSSRVFVEDAVKRQQWESYKRDLGIDPRELDGVVGALEAFLLMAALAVREACRPDSSQR